jgi:hypothetical protein
MSRPDQRRPHHAGPPHPSRLCFSLPSPKICHGAAHSPPATAAMVYVDSWTSWWSGPCSSSVLTPSPANSIHSYPLLSCFVLDSWDEFVDQPRMQQHVRVVVDLQFVCKFGVPVRLEHEAADSFISIEFAIPSSLNLYNLVN